MPSKRTRGPGGTTRATSRTRKPAGGIIPGSYAAQRRVAIAEAAEIEAGPRQEPRPLLARAFHLVSQCFFWAGQLAEQSRLKPIPPAGDFVAYYVRLEVLWPRLAALVKSGADLSTWPRTPGDMFGPETGYNSFDLAYNFARNVGTVACLASGEVMLHGQRRRYDDLPVVPKPHPAFAKWQRRFIADLRKHYLPVAGVFPTPMDVQREVGSRLQKLGAEYQEAIRPTSAAGPAAPTAQASTVATSVAMASAPVDLDATDRRIVDCLRNISGTMTREDLAQELRLAPKTVGKHVERLIGIRVVHLPLGNRKGPALTPEWRSRSGAA